MAYLMILQISRYNNKPYIHKG